LLDIDYAQILPIKVILEEVFICHVDEIRLLLLTVDLDVKKSVSTFYYNQNNYDFYIFTDI